MESISFDPIAHLYDATRGYPEDVAPQIACALEQATQAIPATTFFEVGIGTGRIAFPLASLGHIYTGVDIAPKMLAQLRKKLLDASWQEETAPWGALPDESSAVTPAVQRFSCAARLASMRLVVSSIEELPFHDRSFDVVIAVHVFHLIPRWHLAVREVLRVLRPGGILLHCWDEDAKGDRLLIAEQWRTIMRDLGEEARRPGTPSPEIIASSLRGQGLQPQLLYPLSWCAMVTPRLLIENITQRHWSGTWSIPDTIFTLATTRLWQWAEAYYENELDIPRTQERRFVISKTVVL